MPNRDYSLIDGGMAILKKCVDPSEGSTDEVISRGGRKYLVSIRSAADFP